MSSYYMDDGLDAVSDQIEIEERKSAADLATFEQAGHAMRALRLFGVEAMTDDKQTTMALVAELRKIAASCKERSDMRRAAAFNHPIRSVVRTLLMQEADMLELQAKHNAAHADMLETAAAITGQLSLPFR